MVPSPLLTIVVPAYRVEAYLASCLDSVLGDDGAGDDLEVVAVHDHSPDNCGEILHRYAHRDQRVRVVHLPTNVGLGRARNAGLNVARGDYVWFVDGDDWLPAGSVTAVLARLRLHRPDVLIVDHVETFPDGRETPGTPAGALVGRGDPGPLTGRPQLLGLAHSACTKVVRRGLLDEVGLRFFPGWYEDVAYSHPLLLAAARIDTFDRVCYCYRQRPVGAITKSVSDRHFEVFTQYERMWQWVDRHLGQGRTGVLPLRAQLFRLMIDHLLVIAGNDRRLPPARRQEFFARVSDEYRRRRPAGGYPAPGGLAGLKHRLVGGNAYPVYAALRLTRRAATGCRSLGRVLDTARLAGWLPGSRTGGRTARSRTGVPPALPAQRPAPQPAPTAQPARRSPR